MAEERKPQNPPQNMPNIGRPGGGHGGPMAARMNKQKPKNLGKTLGRLLSYIGASRAILIALLVLVLVVTGADILGPALQGKAIDTITIVDGKFHVDLDEMKKYLLLMGVIFGLSALVNYVQGLLSARLAQNTVYRMRNDLFKKISHLSISYTDNHRHGDMMSSMTNDVENVSNAISQSISTLFSAIITLIGVACMMIYFSPIMTLIAILTIPLTILVSTKLAKFMRKYFTEQQKLLGKLNSHVEEMVTGYRTVVAYGKEKKAVDEFSNSADKLRSCTIKARVFGSLMGPIMNFLGNLQYVLLAITGGVLMVKFGHLPIGASLTPGTIQSMLLYSKKFTHPVNMIANQYSTIMTALAGAERIFAIMDTEDEINEGKTQMSGERMQGQIEFENIVFGYNPEEPVLKNFSLCVEPGQKIAIVGATGSGKTTIINLLMRFYEPQSGRITIDGVDIADIPKENLRGHISIVLQDTVLWSDTIENNIRYGKLGASHEQVKAAADTAMADHFTERLPDGYDTMLSEGGSNLSQGQRQLLAIARAVLEDPRILILDEATSSVDTRTEMNIQKAMINLMKGRTSFIIAHRLSTIRDADVIIVLKDGVIAEAGNHETLIKKCGEYSKLYNKQSAGLVT
ncbi:MAG: ABC transporter ATP-binding protein [Clostridia bacterium]|nr:ABC transporter ATP-binding protein [Clostridia bacterium]